MFIRRKVMNTENPEKKKALEAALSQNNLEKDL